MLQGIANQLEPVLRQLTALMPSKDIQKSLHDGAGTWWSASDMLKSTKRTFSYTSNDNSSSPEIPADTPTASLAHSALSEAMQYGGLHIWGWKS